MNGNKAVTIISILIFGVAAIGVFVTRSQTPTITQPEAKSYINYYMCNDANGNTIGYLRSTPSTARSEYYNLDGALICETSASETCSSVKNLCIRSVDAKTFNRSVFTIRSIDEYGNLPGNPEI